MNEHDSENIAGLLEAMGYEYIDDPYKADVTVINTCSVRENADKRFFGTLGQFKKVRKNNPDFVLAVCGCMPQHVGKEDIYRQKAAFNHRQQSGYR